MEKKSLADILALQDSADAYVYILELTPPDDHLRSLHFHKGRFTGEDVALSNSSRISLREGLADVFTKQLCNWLSVVSKDAGMKEVRDAILAEYELNDMAELPLITALDGLVLPASINAKKRKYMVEVTVSDEAQLNSLDAFVSLALPTFYLASANANITFETKGGFG